jgi:hypothetical protein
LLQQLLWPLKVQQHEIFEHTVTYIWNGDIIMGLGETESLIHKTILSGKSCELESFWFDNVQMGAGIRH